MLASEKVLEPSIYGGAASTLRCSEYLSARLPRCLFQRCWCNCFGAEPKFVTGWSVVVANRHNSNFLLWLVGFFL